MPPPVRYHHVDVFASRPYTGNSLAVFPDATGLDGDQMETITRELRHFESIFLSPAGGPGSWAARVFDLMGELSFAGHPVIGAAAVLHAMVGHDRPVGWTLRLRDRTVQVRTEPRGAGGFLGVLDQGPPAFADGPGPDQRAELAGWFSLDERDLDPSLLPQVVSTGLRYLIMPVRGDALARARISRPDLEAALAALGAEYAYLLDAAAMEGRHWNNDGLVEDAATGSAAGCVAAYLRRHGRLGDGETAILHQGRHIGRPSQLTLRAHGPRLDVRSVHVGGQVWLVGTGSLEVLPAGDDRTAPMIEKGTP
jgi:trans-2,3-dihydro-3-hydroxyanthranilate isomerase